MNAPAPGKQAKRGRIARGAASRRRRRAGAARWPTLAAQRAGRFRRAPCAEVPALFSSLIHRLLRIGGALLLGCLATFAGAQVTDPVTEADAPPEPPVIDDPITTDDQAPPVELLPYEESAQELDVDLDVPAQPPSPTEILDPSREPELEERMEPVVQSPVENRPIEIFDPGKGEELTPIQRAALSQAQRRAALERRSLADIQNLVTYEYELAGTSEQEILREAMVRSLKSAAGRLYFGNYYLLGLDLLDPYLRQHGRPFIASVDVLERRFLPNDQIWLHVRMSVNLDDFYKELDAKQFIARPNLLPNVGVMIHEIIEGQPDPTGQARVRVERALEENLLQTYSERMRQPDTNTDASATPMLLQQARLEAQRQDIDVLITGTVTVTEVPLQQIYTIEAFQQGDIFYDRYTFREVKADLDMYRVDNGELLLSLTDRYPAAADTARDAMNAALDELLIRMTQRFADHLREYWTATMAYKGEDYRVMVSGVAPEQIPGIYGLVQSLDPEVKVYEKSFYGGVLVFNVVLPERAPLDLEGFLRQSHEPQFVVNRVGRRQLQLEVL